jgi:hypothetical protein
MKKNQAKIKELLDKIQYYSHCEGYDLGSSKKSEGANYYERAEKAKSEVLKLMESDEE